MFRSVLAASRGASRSIPRASRTVSGASRERPGGTPNGPRSLRRRPGPISSQCWLDFGSLDEVLGPSRSNMSSICSDFCLRARIPPPAEGMEQSRALRNEKARMIISATAPFTMRSSPLVVRFSFDRGSLTHVYAGIFLRLASVLSDRPLSFRFSLAVI